MMLSNVLCKFLHHLLIDVSRFNPGSKMRVLLSQEFFEVIQTHLDNTDVLLLVFFDETLIIVQKVDGS